LARAPAYFCALVLAAMAVVSAAARKQPAAVMSVTITPKGEESVLAINASGSLTPKIETAEGPLRLVIDLPNATLTRAHKKIPFRNEQIKGVRVSQYQSEPAVTRIVVDLASPVRYNWDALGNQLNIRIRPDEAATAKPMSVPALTAGEQPVAVPYATGASGSLVEAGSRVGSGSSITAKEETAVLRLTRGGEVRVCAGTQVSVATSSGGNDLMLGMGTGTIETHYHLEDSSDSVLTPDFRIVLPGPGEFNLAIRADSHGNTCISSQAGSTSSVIVAELLGAGTYEVKPLQEAFFRQGKLDSVERPETDCGCPPPPEPVLRASSDPNSVIPEDKAASKLQLDNSTTTLPAAGSPSVISNSTPSGDMPAERAAGHSKAETKVDMEPLVFSGRAQAKAHPPAPPAPMLQAAALPLSIKAADPLPAVVVLPPSEPKRTNKGFFGRVKGLFGSIFH
jgi:AMIN domain